MRKKESGLFSMEDEQVLDSYLGLSAEYYTLDKPEPPQDALDFYIDYIKSAPHPILEPMCGTGRFLIPIIQRGYDIEGFDASSFMLEHLHDRCSSLNLRPRIWHGFLENISDINKYGLIFIPSGSLGLITNHELLKQSLQVIYNALIPSGKFVFDVKTLKAVPKKPGMWTGSIRRRSDNKQILLSKFDLPFKNNITTSIRRYDLIDINSIVKSEVEEFSVMLHEVNYLKSILDSIGFKTIKLIKAFNKNEIPDVEDECVAFECIK